MDNLIEKLKQEIVEHLNLEHLKAEEIDAEAPLFGDGVGLDSIDALELIVLLEKNYGIKITSAEEGKEVFQSVSAMASYIESKKS
ncbi:phosphopantetheine-binding protein [Cytophagaceae bacterium ABcell3]|nr:phosphopantetheine-binding protein [Cytophagaceae bacterium ABcell3]